MAAVLAAVPPSAGAAGLEEFGHDPWWLVLIKAVPDLLDPRAADAVQHLVRASRGGPDAAPHRPQRERPLRPPAEPRRRREAGAEGGHHPEGRRQGGLPRRPGDRGDPGVRHLLGDPVRPGRHGPVHRAAHPVAADRHARRGAVRDGDRLGRHLRHRPRRLVQRVDVLPARRPPLERADDLLRGRDGPRARRGVPLRRLDVDQPDRRRAGHLVVRPDPGSVVRDLHDRDGRRDQPRAVRPPRGRGRAGRRLPHRVLQPEVRAVLPGRVHQHGDRLRAGHDAVPRRLARAVLDRPRVGRARTPATGRSCGSWARCSSSSSSSSGCAARCPGCATTSSWRSAGSGSSRSRCSGSSRSRRSASCRSTAASTASTS